VRSIDPVGPLTKQAADEMGLPEGIAVFGGCDDTQSAAVGTTAIGEGEAHIYTGTSAWVGVSTSRSPKFKHGAFCLQSADPEKNIVVGITESAGVNTEWILNNFYTYEKATMTADELFVYLENDIRNVKPGSDYLLMTPWFLGERCPVSTTTTRSTIFNLTHDHSRAHIARAHFEGIAYNLRWAIENFEKDFGFDIRELKITGGGSYNKTWMQIIADVTKRKIITTSQPKNAGALGAAMCAMVGSGVFKDFSQVQKLIQPAETFVPNEMNRAVYDTLFDRYRILYRKLRRPYMAINRQRFALK
jgi:xylulokinase